MVKNLKAHQIKRGMVVDIYDGTQRVAVTKDPVTGSGSVQISDGFEWFGLDKNETVKLAGHFNP